MYVLNLLHMSHFMLLFFSFFILFIFGKYMAIVLQIMQKIFSAKLTTGNQTSAFHCEFKLLHVKCKLPVRMKEFCQDLSRNISIFTTLLIICVGWLELRGFRGSKVEKIPFIERTRELTRQKRKARGLSFIWKARERKRARESENIW